MLLSRIAEASTALAATRSRNLKRALIADVLRDAQPDDIEIVVSYLSGTLRQRRTGLGWASLHQVPDPSPTPALTVGDVDTAFDKIARLSGAGSVGARAGEVNALFGLATGAEQKLLLGLVFEELRQGALEAVVQEGLAIAFDAPLALVRRAAMLLGSTSVTARLLAVGGTEALHQVGLQVGVPIAPMLAASAADPAAAAQKAEFPVLADYKLDGIRVQVHRADDRVLIFTRSLDEITDRLPEVVAAVRALPQQQLVLDGEVLAVRADGRPEIFQVIASRTASQVEINALAERTPLSVYFFDLLHADGVDYLDLPLRERAAAMAELLPADMVVPRHRVGTEHELTEVFTDAVQRGFEGIVMKSLVAGYAAGRRDSAWIKIKPRHTFDLVVTAAEWGHGRRQGWLSNLHLAARDGDSGNLIMLGKTFKGLTDELLRWQTEQFLQHEIRRSSGTVFIEPGLVVEIACDGIQRSTRYPGGIALRFARVLRYRPDKDPTQADTIETVRRLLPVVEGAGQ